MTKKLLITTISLIALCIFGFIVVNVRKGSVSEPQVSEVSAEYNEKYPGENDEQYHDTDSILVVANKKHPLPAGYEPQDLIKPNVDMMNECYVRSLVSDALENMFVAAAADEVHLLLGAGYRGEVLQRQLYDSYVDQYGASAADYISSRPGYCDHQTGLAVDISGENTSIYLTEDFAETQEGQWLLSHAYEYGFILRYPQGKEEITGYGYEPWHYRYVGPEAAEKMYNSGNWLTMEEYCQVEGGSYGK